MNKKTNLSNLNKAGNKNTKLESGSPKPGSSAARIAAMRGKYTRSSATNTGNKTPKK